MDINRTRNVLLNEGNVWQSAIVMLRSHGTGARREARRRADALEKSGDVPGSDAWQRIENAIVMLAIHDKNAAVPWQ